MNSFSPPSSVISLQSSVLRHRSIAIEEGACTINPITGDYQFIATVEVSDLTGVTIIARATDLPGHIDQLSVTL